MNISCPHTAFGISAIFSLWPITNVYDSCLTEYCFYFYSIFDIVWADIYLKKTRIEDVQDN